MSWGNLSGIWLLGPVFIGCALVVLIAKFKNYLLDVLAKSGAVKLSRGGLGIIKLRALLWLLALVGLLIAFLAPQWGESSQLAPQKGRDIVVAVDVSKSMLAQDFKPNRLLFAKGKIKKLINSLYGDRVGLILFSGDAFVMCPLTRDKDILLAFLDDAQVETISGGTTNTAKAIEVAVKMMKQVGGSATKLLTIFTDGEDFSQGLAAAGDLAKKEGLHIFTIGVATTKGAPIPNVDLNGAKDGFVKNKQGVVVISKLNRKLLRDISVKCGGDYVEAVSSDDSDMQEVVNFITKFERKQITAKVLSVQAEKYYYFAALSLVLLLIEWIL
jgi:Ca-activated chloride channel family protein